MAFSGKTIFRSFRIGVIWRVLLLVSSLLLFIYLLYETEFVISPFVIAVVVSGLVINLIIYVEQTNKKLARFLNSIHYNDFSQSFTTQESGKSFDDLQKAFSRISDQFRAERTERQESIRYLETIVQHVGIGLISFDHKGEVSLINNSAKRMLNLPTLRTLDGLNAVSEKLFRVLKQIRGGSRSLVHISRDGEVMQWAVFATEFIMRGVNYKLVSLQNISSELEEKEMEAWQNLTQVLAHEIMNSITPIASLSETVNMLVSSKVRSKDGENRIDSETLRDVRDALDTIHKRSHGLMRFVQSYRDFTQIPEPDYKIITVYDLLQRVRHLMKGEFEKKSIHIDVNVDPESLTLSADPQLIEQILINLTKNALRALEGTDAPEITFEAGLSGQGRTEISVRDNGPGIKKEVLDKIFIPFYTSASAGEQKNSGIGLSLSRQIMRNHHGSLTVTSSQNEGTVFTLRF